MSLAIIFNIKNILEEHNLSANALAREAKVRPNLIYDLCSNETKRLDLETFNKIITTLNGMTGKKIPIQDIIKYVE